VWKEEGRGGGLVAVDGRGLLLEGLSVSESDEE
jgi:hypothetical protein